MARKSRDEVGAADLDDFESGRIPHRCWACGSDQEVRVKVYYTEWGDSVLTKNRIGVCSNKECYRHTGKVESWPAETTISPDIRRPGASRSYAVA